MIRSRDEKPVKGDLKAELARGNRFAKCIAEAERERVRRDLAHAKRGIKVFPAPKTKVIPQASEPAPQPEPKIF